MLFACCDKHRNHKRLERHDSRCNDGHDHHHHDRPCFCNRAFAPGERMFVCREKHCSHDKEDRFECRRVPNCCFRRRCSFCDIFGF